MAKRLIRMAVWLALLSGLAAALVFWQHHRAEQALVHEGQRIFAKGELVTAHIDGHAEPLPSLASRCVNCHRADAGAQAFGPQLGARLLTEPHPRRGGPPSKYDEAAFCKLLATGIDPAQVMLGGPMPRYQISPAHCHALWTYLLQGDRYDVK